MGGRRTSLASLAGDTVDKVPGQNDPTLARLSLSKVVPTPLNPRTDFGGPDSLTELGESMRKRQLQPVVVIGRTSYLDLFPEHTEQLGEASHVVINGERRYRAARHCGFGSIETIIREEIATAREDILDAVLSENIDRKNFDPIEEALAVQAMVKECGTAVAAAKKFRRTGGWVSQRIALLRLIPELQALVRPGQMPVRIARELAALPADDQMPEWKRRVAERSQPKQSSKSAGPATVQDSNREPPPAAPPHRRAGPAPVESPAATESPEIPVPAIPSPAAPSRPGEGLPERIPTPPAGVPEPAWAVDDTSAEVTEARRMVAEFSYAERQRIIRFLLAIGDTEKLAAEATAA